MIDPTKNTWCDQPIPATIVDAIVKAFPNDAKTIIETELRQAYDHYCFNKWGMYVGVEYDGYIHT